ncbi:DUF1961 family protein [Planctomonas sp. JC2975]|uniref:DUF1961 family protein n=1 Tax=Planctomonas sp. JC2975 TaxID=2729626 RepID=UPI003211E570
MSLPTGTAEVSASTESIVLYTNPLRTPGDIADWIPEGPMRAVAGQEGLELESTGDEAVLGDRAHFTVWCPEALPDGIRISWSFRPLTDEGLAMVFFAAEGIGADLFSAGLAARDGYYPQYHSGDIRTLHASYYRRKWLSERRFTTANLRKSPGFQLVAQGADPLPAVADVDGFYRVHVEKDGASVRFGIDDLTLFDWRDESGDVLGGGRIGFRHMAPLRAAYRDLEVTSLHT